MLSGGAFRRCFQGVQLSQLHQIYLIVFLFDSIPIRLVQLRQLHPLTNYTTNQLHPLTNCTTNQHNSAQIPLISINTENKSCLIFHVWIFIAKFARNKFFKLYVIICC